MLIDSMMLIGTHSALYVHVPLSDASVHSWYLESCDLYTVDLCTANFKTLPPRRTSLKSCSCRDSAFVASKHDACSLLLQVVHMDKPHQDKPPKMPSDNYNYHSKLVNEWRTDLKPLNVDQPEGPSFNVNNTPPSTLPLAVASAITP